MAQISINLEHYEEAIIYANNGLQKAQKIGEPWGTGRAHRVMGEISGVLGSKKINVEPVFHFEESIRILRKIGAEAELARSMASYGFFLRPTDQSQKSSKLIEDAKTIFQKLGMKPAISRLERDINSCLSPDQHKVRLPHISAPTGRPLRDTEWVTVNWTITNPEDNAIQGKVARRQHRLRRLLDEARSQGAAPTVTDLASVLETSSATIKRDLAFLRESGLQVQTRGSREASKK